MLFGQGFEAKDGISMRGPSCPECTPIANPRFCLGKDRGLQLDKDWATQPFTISGGLQLDKDWHPPTLHDFSRPPIGQRLGQPNPCVEKDWGPPPTWQRWMRFQRMSPTAFQRFNIRFQADQETV